MVNSNTFKIQGSIRELESECKIERALWGVEWENDIIKTSLKKKLNSSSRPKKR